MKSQKNILKSIEALGDPGIKGILESQKTTFSY